MPVVADRATEAAENVPAPTLMVLETPPFPGLCMVTAPLGVNDAVASARLIAAAPTVPVVKSIVVHCAAYPDGTVTVIPELIVTESAEPGTDEPPHVAVLLQLPLTEAILAAAAALSTKTAENANTAIRTIAIDRMIPLRFLIFLIYFSSIFP